LVTVSPTLIITSARRKPPISLPMWVSCQGMMLPVASIWSGQSALFGLTSVTGVAGATGATGAATLTAGDADTASATGAFSVTAAESGADACACEKLAAHSANTVGSARQWMIDERLRR